MAATTIDELQVLITAQASGFQAQIKDVQRQIAELDKSVKNVSQSMPKSFKKIGAAAVALGSVISAALVSAFRSFTALGSDAVKRLDTLNSFPRAMSNLGISADLSQKAIQVLSDKLMGLPTALDDAAMSVQRFTSANGSIAASTQMFLALNNAILAGGAPMELQRTALEQLSQAYTKGKPDMMEWRSAMSAMPAQLKQIATAMNFASADALGAALREGKVSMNDFMMAVVRLNKEGLPGFQSFEQQARNSTGGVATSIANLRTAIVRGLADIMNAIGQANIAGFFNAISRAVSAAIPYIVAFIKVMMMAVSWFGSLFGIGKKQADSMTKSTQSAAKSVGSIGAGAADASSGMNDAAGSAKKLKKELAGLAAFDEMNVLKEPDASAAGGGGAGGGIPDLSGLDFGDFGKSLDKVTPKVEAILESLRKVGDVLKRAWDSAPVQAFVGAAGSAIGFFIELIKQLGLAAWQNLTETWAAIQPNVMLGLSNITMLWTQFWLDVQAAIDTWGPVIIDSTVGVFNSIWKDAIDPALKIAAQIWADFTGILLENWQKYGASILDDIGQFVNNTIKLFQSVWDNVLAPIIRPFLEELSSLWNEHLKDLVNEVVGFVARLVQAALNIYNNFIVPVSNFLLKVLSPAFSFIGQLVSGVMGTVLGTIASVVKSIFGIFNGLIDFISGVFSGDWRKAWDGVKSIFGNIFGGFAAIAKAPLNAMIDIINGFISGLNRIKIPDWVPEVGGKGINIPKIPKLATGGIISAPTMALVGEAGREAVLPLDRNTGWMDELASKINGNGQPIHLTVKLGEDTLMERVIGGINDAAFMRNENVLTI